MPDWPWLVIALVGASLVFPLGCDDNHDASATDDDQTPPDADDDDNNNNDDDNNDNDDNDTTTNIEDWRWSEYPGDGPSARVMARMVWDEAASRVLLFGGGLGWPTNETWTWDGDGWTLMHPPTSPGVRLACGMAYDPLRQRAVVFGGTAIFTFRNDTWEFDGDTWREINPAHRPAIRAQMGMAYLPRIERAVLFGGCNEDECWNNFNDTWAYDGADWEELFPAASPSPRNGGVMFYDAGGDQLVYFGGVSDGKGTDETWLFDGDTWSLVTPAVSPVPRYTPAAACDDADGWCVLFGGDGGYTYGYLNDTWLWRDGAWQELGPFDPAPSPRTQMAMAYDPSARGFVLHGGFYASEVLPFFYGDTWLFGPP